LAATVAALANGRLDRPRIQWAAKACQCL